MPVIIIINKELGLGHLVKEDRPILHSAKFEVYQIMSTVGFYPIF